ncbi:uncharacterized protein LOC122497741 [Leptopilina heterotoma]|nr:uncharacterized protein LOC122497741 [Leptopilina heterotoma]
MRKFSEDCGATMPETLRGTFLRKHLATYSAVLGINENEMQDLANFMGHDEKIHKDVYRLPNAVKDVTEVSKFLQAAIENENSANSSVSELRVGKSVIAEERSDSDFELETSDEEESKNCYRSSISKIKRTKWSTEEQDVVTNFFGPLKSLPKLPSLHTCQDLISNNEVLKNRAPQQLKTWIDNQRKKDSRKRKSI